MANLKHIGRIKDTGRKCLVVFRTLPGDAFNCLIITTENLDDSYHTALINLVESPSAQDAVEFAEVLARAVFPDGSTMLPSLHVKKLLSKVATDRVEMTPNNSATILLSELNQLIAEQKGISVQDLAIKPTAKENAQAIEVASAKDISPPTGNTDPIIDQQVAKTTAGIVDEEPLSDEAIARKYRSDADRLSKEAAQLRRMAEDLVPTKKKVAVSE